MTHSLSARRRGTTWTTCGCADPRSSTPTDSGDRSSGCIYLATSPHTYIPQKRQWYERGGMKLWRSGSTSRSPDDRGRDKCNLEAEFQREFQQREFQQRSLQMAGKKSRSDQKSYRLRHRRFWARHNEEWATPPLVSIPGVSPRWSSIDIEYSLVKLVCDPLACKKQQNDILILGHDYYR